MDWRDYDSEFDRINRRLEIKDGSYRYLHRDECCCVGCCGLKLAKEIQEFYTPTISPTSVIDSTRLF